MLHDQDLVSVQEVRAKVEKAHAAWQTFRNVTQEQADAIVEAMAARARLNARRLAEMAVEETGMGNAADKLAKNLLCADLLPRYIRGMKTLGVLREIPEQKITEIGVPAGVVAAILPTTNPTSTAIYKTIIALKAGNAIVLSPHPRAKNCTCATAALLAEAAVEAGAPADLIQCITAPTIEGTNALMKHPRTAVILSTGGSGIVKAAYSSGKPAFGVGPGNVPILLDTSADVSAAIGLVVDGKSFDYGTVCSSEQTVVAERSLRDRVLSELKAHGAHLLSAEDTAKVQAVLFVDGYHVSAACVGQSPQKIAQLAGISVPANARILVAEIHGVGKQHPLSAEKLSPVLAVYFVDHFQAAMDACEGILKFGGLGHTCVIYAKDEAKVREYGLRMPAFRILVNTAAPQGSVGITTGLQPSMTLGCGAVAGNSTSDNVGPQHLINIKRIAWIIRRPEEALTIPQASGSVDRSAVAALVDQYLARRGITPSPAAAPPLRASVETIVDQFLGARPAPTCGCALPPPPAPVAAPKPAEPPAPKITIVDFVCEADVRSAMGQNKKIYIGPKTIVTPAARELAGRDETLVMAQR